MSPNLLARKREENLLREIVKLRPRSEITRVRITLETEEKKGPSPVEGESFERYLLKGLNKRKQTQADRTAKALRVGKRSVKYP